MPIKPENKKRYPANWPEIRERILTRANHRCERCMVRNYTQIMRGRGHYTGTYLDLGGNLFNDKTGEYLGRCRITDYHCNGDGMTRIVLTIAHLDHTPENCEDDNLLALCQKCHLDNDREYHAQVRARTLAAKKAIGDFFEGDKA